MRYIDADKLIDKIFPIGLVDDGKYTINAKAVKVAIDKMPTADVVPKSEVERLKRQLEPFKKKQCFTCKYYDIGHDHVPCCYCEDYDKYIWLSADADTDICVSNSSKVDNAKEVAREIFEEIEDNSIIQCLFNSKPMVTINLDTYTKLKKKYTEGEHDEQI